MVANQARAILVVMVAMKENHTRITMMMAVAMMATMMTMTATMQLLKLLMKAMTKHHQQDGTPMAGKMTSTTRPTSSTSVPR